MQTSLHVLSVGRDPRLMATRRRALATRYDVLVLNDPAEMSTVPHGAAFDVVLLCHTLSPHESSRMMEEAQKRWPAARILSITNGYMDWTHCPPEVTIPGIAGPRALIARIDGLMGLPQAS